MGTATYERKGFKERARGSGERPIASFRQQSIQVSCQTPPRTGADVAVWECLNVKPPAASPHISVAVCTLVPPVLQSFLRSGRNPVALWRLKSLKSCPSTPSQCASRLNLEGDRDSQSKGWGGVQGIPGEAAHVWPLLQDGGPADPCRTGTRICPSISCPRLGMTCPRPCGWISVALEVFLYGLCPAVLPPFPPLDSSHAPSQLSHGLVRGALCCSRGLQ